MVADPDDPAAVAQAIRELRSDPSRLLEMGKRAAESAKKYARVNELQHLIEIMEDTYRQNGGRHLEG
jgi:glycosyltransferase involved in cell wall biosynthesis